MNNKHILIAKKILAKKKLSYNDLEKLESELSLADYYNDFKKDYQLLNLYGKFYLAKGDLSKAQHSFESAIKVSPFDTPKASYYGLFKVAINKNDYEQARKMLALYDSCFDENFNMKFYFKCLDKICKLEGKQTTHTYYCNESKGYINCVNAPKSVLDLYKKAEEYFDNYEYEVSYKIILKAQKLCIVNNYPFDFTSLIKIIHNINELYNKKIVEDSLINLDLIKGNNEKKEYLKSLIKDSKNVHAMIKLINIYISEENYDEAYFCLNHQMDKKETQKHIKELNLLRKKVYEMYNYKNNDEKIKSYLDKAQEFIDKKELIKAIKVYKEGYDVLSSPVFLFKIGEISYFIKNISNAKKYFVKYMDNGCKYEDECYMYLGYIDLITKKDSDEKDYFENEYLAKKYLSEDNYDEKKNLNKYFEKFFGNKDVSKKLLDLDEKAVVVYLNIIKNKVADELANKDKNFINYYNEILASIKRGKLYKIEKIDKNKHDPLEIALIQIAAAPILLDMGQTYLAEKYYQRAQIFIDDEAVLELCKKYEKKRNEKN